MSVLKSVGCLMAAGVLASVCASAAQASSVLVADYQFNNNLSSSVAGAPDLIFPTTGGGTTNTAPGSWASESVLGSSKSVFVFPTTSGLKVDVSSTLGQNNKQDYTVAMLFRVDANTNNWISILDGLNDGDQHTYIQGGHLDLDDGSTNYVGSIAQNQWIQVIESVSTDPNDPNRTSATKGLIVSAAVGTGSGQTIKNLTAVNHWNSFVIKNGAALNLFRDDGGDISPSGAIARLEVYQGGMTNTEMAALDLTSTTSSSPSTVPLPSALWAGLSLMALLPVGRMLRRR